MPAVQGRETRGQARKSRKLLGFKRTGESMTAFKVVESRKLYEGKVISLIVDEVEYQSGQHAVREVADHPGGAAIVPLLDDGRILFVRQHRYPLREFVTELPAGKLHPGEDPFTCARRELLEETGYEAETIVPLGTIYTSPGFCTERLHLFMARGLHPGSGQRLEEGEESLTVTAVPFEEALEMIHKGELVDAKTICGILLTKDRLRG